MLAKQVSAVAEDPIRRAASRQICCKQRWMRSVIYTVSQKTSHLWFATTLTYVNAFWYFFGRNVTDKVSNQKTLYCATPNNLCFCTTWQNGEHKNRIFSLKYCMSALPEFSQSLLDFSSLFDSRLILTAVWLPKSCNQCAEVGAVGSMVQEKGSRERRSSRTALHAAQCMCTNALPSWKKKNVVCDSVWHLLR